MPIRHRGPVPADRGPGGGDKPRITAGDISPRIIVGAAVAVAGGIIALILLVQVVSAFKSTPVDKVGLSYTGGPIAGIHFQRVVKPGSGQFFNGFFASLHELPATQRNYIVSKNPDEGDRHAADFIPGPTKDRVIAEIELAVTFKLNTEPKTVRQFYEQLCVKYHCEDLSPRGGWDKLLNDNFRQVLENAVQQETRQINAADLNNNQEVITKMQTDIASHLKDDFNQVLGGNFFCGPTFDRNRPTVCPDFKFVIKNITLPPDLQAAFTAQQSSAAGVVVKQNEAAQVKATAEGVAAQQNAVQASLTPQYLEYLKVQAETQCAQRPGCTLVISNGATSPNVNINPPGNP